jgi:hypothetical protein
VRNFLRLRKRTQHWSLEFTFIRCNHHNLEDGDRVDMMRVSAAALAAALVSLASAQVDLGGNNYDQFNYRSTSTSPNNDYGPEEWGKVRCGDLDTCVSVLCLVNTICALVSSVLVVNNSWDGRIHITKGFNGQSRKTVVCGVQRQQGTMANAVAKTISHRSTWSETGPWNA